MHYLGQSMHARIRASGACGNYPFTGNLAQCAIKDILHATPMGLALPSAEGAAVVFHAKDDSQAMLRKGASLQHAAAICIKTGLCSKRQQRQNALPV